MATKSPIGVKYMRAKSLVIIQFTKTHMYSEHSQHLPYRLKVMNRMKVWRTFWQFPSMHQSPTCQYLCLSIHRTCTKCIRDLFTHSVDIVLVPDSLKKRFQHNYKTCTITIIKKNTPNNKPNLPRKRITTATLKHSQQSANVFQRQVNYKHAFVRKCNTRKSLFSKFTYMQSNEKIVCSNQGLYIAHMWNIFHLWHLLHWFSCHHF